MKINAKTLDFRELNEIVRKAVRKGAESIVLDNVNGQRYIGCGLRGKVKISIKGVPGNDLGAFMDGPLIEVFGNAQDAVGNTMNGGRVIVHGSAGDITGYSMRGGEIYVKEDVGYRIGIHMKSYKENIPVIVVGGVAYDFLGEYMAGGLLIVLGLNKKKKPIAGEWIGTGMHGGTIYLRGQVEDYQLGKEVKAFKASTKDIEDITPHIKGFCKHFSCDAKKILSEEFTKLVPYTHRPYGRIYSY
jgi:glutamate synthase domain-containing protein 3